MAELYREEIVRVDLGSPLRRYSVGKVLATGDDRANRFGAEVFRRGAAVSLDGGKVNGYFIPPEGEALLLDGSATGNTAYVELHGACYAQEGRFSLAVKVTADGVTTTLCVFDGWIVATSTDEVRDPGGIVPSLDDILEKIADMEQATEETRQATSDAEDTLAEVQAATAELLGSAASSVVVPASGSAINVQDACEGRAFPALSLMGKTTQAGTPSPSAPVELVSIPVGSVTAHVAGVNLLRWEALTVPEATTVADDGSITVANDSTSKTYYPRTTGIYLPAGTFTLSVSRQYASAMLYFRPEGSATPDSIARITGSSSATFTIQAGWYEIMFTVDPGTSETLRIQLQTGSAATAYEPPVLGAASLTLTNSLRGVPVTSGGNYTDENGQQWICDEVDLMRGKLIRRVAQVDFDGSENWVTSGTNASGFVVWLSKTDEPHLDKSAILCNRCGYAAGSSASNPSGTTFGIQRGGSNNNIQFFVPYSMCADLSAWKALVKQWHDAGAPLCKVYTAAFPVETDLSADEVAAFLQLRSPYGPMTVYNDAGAGLQVSYVADTKLYIDQKMAAIAQAVLNM